jgi:integrase
MPNGENLRKRERPQVSSKSAAQKWGEARERELILHGPPKPEKEVPTLEEFAPRFMLDAKANQQKPSGIAAKDSILRTHLVPHLGDRKLDAITTADVQALKGKLAESKPKTVNNALTVLNTLLKKAVEWAVIERMPCSIKLLKADRPDMHFYGEEEYERLVEATVKSDWRSHLIVLLGGEAGMRCGEMMALQWNDVDFNLGQISIRRSDWEGQVTSPKGGRSRTVSMTSRLARALRDHRHVRSHRVLCRDDGEPLTRQMVQTKAAGPAKSVGLREGVHVLLHTF